jgi:uncharacterized phiE125 gp8 family phage protein
MALHLVTAPTAEPITTAVAKLHLKVDHSLDDDLIDSLCMAAREMVETDTGRKCISQTWDLKLDCFPSGAIVLPFPPVTSVTSVSYVDTNGTTQTWSSSLYSTDLPPGAESSPGRIYPVYSESYPSIRSQRNAVTVRFVCGFTSSTVPGRMVAAMKLLIGHWYANRESVVVGTISTELDQAVQALTWQSRVGGSYTYA